mmetsp:Transcript_31402/g.54438  ORF Transcript_31402/g.54438 Transcript_31402/m.54438 type:complete len:80 (-) Transcript_31402:22-261(-)
MVTTALHCGEKFSQQYLVCEVLGLTRRPLPPSANAAPCFQNNNITKGVSCQYCQKFRLEVPSRLLRAGGCFMMKYTIAI